MLVPLYLTTIHLVRRLEQIWRSLGELLQNVTWNGVIDIRPQVVDWLVAATSALNVPSDLLLFRQPTKFRLLIFTKMSHLKWAELFLANQITAEAGRGSIATFYTTPVFSLTVEDIPRWPRKHRYGFFRLMEGECEGFLLCIC